MIPILTKVASSTWKRHFSLLALNEELAYENLDNWKTARKGIIGKLVVHTYEKYEIS